MLIVIDDVLEAELMSVGGDSGTLYPHSVYKRVDLDLTMSQRDFLKAKVREDALLTAELVYSLQSRRIFL